MKLTFINIGFGESILIEHQGFRILVDAGLDRRMSGKDVFHPTPAFYLETHAVQHLDLLIITHIHDDHCSNLPDLVRTCDIGQILVNDWPIAQTLPFTASQLGLEPNGGAGSFLTACEAYFEGLALAADRAIPIEKIQPQATRLEPISGLILGLLPPPLEAMSDYHSFVQAMLDARNESEFLTAARQADRCSNAASVSIHLRSPEFSALLTSDRADRWKQTIQDCPWVLQANVLKAAHHGIADPEDEQILLETVQPDAYVICTSWDRRYQTPAPEAVARAEAYFRNHDKPVRIHFTDSVDWPPYSSAETRAGALEVSWESGPAGEGNLNILAGD